MSLPHGYLVWSPANPLRRSGGWLLPVPWHLLYLIPLPHGHAAFRPTFGTLSDERESRPVISIRPPSNAATVSRRPYCAWHVGCTRDRAVVVAGLHGLVRVGSVLESM